jgi:hypothetical protein
MFKLTRLGLRPARGLLSASVPALFALTALGGTAANAAIKETATVQNRFGYVIGSQTSPVAVGPDKMEIYVAGNNRARQSETGINYVGTASVGSFFFLHDDYCVGSCATYSETVITFTLTNEGDTPVDLRFDSQITPGHIAMITGDARMEGEFNFDVVQTLGGENFNLYNANGGVNSDGIFLNTGRLNFNGLNSQRAADGSWEVLDWSATNLSLPLLTLDSGQTTQISYIATYEVFSSAACNNLLNCQGLQIVFGDPRNDGGVSNLSDLAFGPEMEAIYPVIGRNYDPTEIFARFVPIDSPFPENPQAAGPWRYGPLFDPRAAIPEPATWAMMIGGFGLMGGAMRRRATASRRAVA